MSDLKRCRACGSANEVHRTGSAACLAAELQRVKTELAEANAVLVEQRDVLAVLRDRYAEDVRKLNEAVKKLEELEPLLANGRNR